MIFADRKKNKKVAQSPGKKSGRKHMPFLILFKILKSFKIMIW
jgi:hypothetical protein